MKTALPFQRAGIEMLDKGVSLLADDPGLGKTFQALKAIQNFESRHPALVSCPSGVAGVWAYEYQSIEPGAEVLILSADNLAELARPEIDMVVVSVDLPARNKKVAAALRQLKYDIYVADEAHYLSEPSSSRTQLWLTSSHALARDAARTILLSGTPTPRHVGQLWSLIKGTEPARLHDLDWLKFCERFCRWSTQELPNGRVLRRPTGNLARAVVEFKPWLTEGDVPWWLRRKKEAVLPDLPPKAPPRVIGLDVSDTRELDSFLATPEGKRVAEAIRRKDLRLIEDYAVGEQKNHVGRLRKLIGEAKAEAAADYVEHVLRNETPRGLVVWAWHPSVLEIIAKRFEPGEYVMTTGATASEQRTVNAARFQHPNGPPLFLGQMVAAGIGVTLTKADRAIFVERAWTPAVNKQAWDRIDRIGQTAPMLQEDTLVLANSIDDAVMAVNETREREWADLEDVTYYN